MNRARASMLGLAVALFSTEAHTSGRREELTLQQVVQESTVVVVVVPATPPTRQSSVDITPAGKQPSEAFPPYGRPLTRWVVREVLADAEGTLKVGDTLEVDRGNFSYWLTIHQKRYLEGVNKIALIPTYEPRKSDAQGPERIALVRKHALGFEYTAEGSLETLAAKAEIVKLLKERGPTLRGKDVSPPRMP